LGNLEDQEAKEQLVRENGKGRMDDDRVRWDARP
jgi:hypothetical protein